MIVLWGAALAADVINQVSPIALPMSAAAFWSAVTVIAVVLLLTGVAAARLKAENFAVAEQSVLVVAGVLIFFQCSVTGGSESPYVGWYLLTSFYAAYLLPLRRAVLNLALFSGLAALTLLQAETDISSTVLLRLGVLVATIWVVGSALMRHRRRENDLARAVKFLALADPLTSLANMRSFEDHLAQLLRTDNQRFAIAVVDMNGLKGANAVFGHETGDDMLVRTAQMMLAACGERDQVSRFGGDEFAVVLEDGGADELRLWRERFEDEILRQNQAVRGRRPPVSVAIGGALYPDDALSPDDLLDLADRRMYEEKRTIALPSYELGELTAGVETHRLQGARFADAPQYATDLHDWMIHAQVNWLVFAALTFAMATVSTPVVHTAVAVGCGALALIGAAVANLQLRRPQSRSMISALDVLAILLPLPLIWSTGGAASPLLLTTVIPVAFYAQHFAARVSLPRIAILVAMTVAGFLSGPDPGKVEVTYLVSALAATFAITFVMRYSFLQQEAALATIRRSAASDRLTGLPNAVALRRDVFDPERPVGPLSLAVFDLDDFRRSNSVAGHRGGDLVLIDIAERISLANPQHRVYRIGGDEFAVLVEGGSEATARELAEATVRTIAHEHDFGDVRVEITASFGIAHADDETARMAIIDTAEQDLQINKPPRRGPASPPGRILL